MSKVPFRVENGLEPTTDNSVDLGTVTNGFRNVRAGTDVIVGNDLTVNGEFNQGGVASASEEDAIVYAIVLGG